MKIVQSSRPSIRIDLNEFKLHLHFKSRAQLTLHFDSPSRRFYLSVIALVVNEMKRLGKIKSISLQEHLDLLILLNESIGGSAGSSGKVNLLHRIYTKWRDALPNLEEAPLFKVLGKKKEVEEGAIGKIYSFADLEKDEWANLFEYMGSEENVRLKFAIDRIGATLDDVVILYEYSLNAEAWEKFISGLKEKKAEPAKPVSGEPEIAAPLLERRGTLLASRNRWVALMAAIVVVLGTITLVIWKAYLKPGPGDVASIEKMAFPLPNVPSIAILPLVNLSEDPKQEYFCDGMTEEIITALSKVPRLFVIAGNSTLRYKGKPVKFKQVSEDLGVRYVLKGGIQRSGNRVRITIQVIDALTGNELLAERYDRDLKDIFALQDEITMRILMEVRVKLEGGDVSRLEKYAEKYYRGKQGLDCYLKLIEASGYQARFNIEDNSLARRLAEDAIAMCPENPMGYVRLGSIYHYDYWLGTTKSPRETLEKSIELVQKALTMDDSMANGHSVLCMLYAHKGEYDKAIAEGERAVALSPGNWVSLTSYAHSLTLAGRPEEAIPLLQKAIRLTPFGGPNLYCESGLALRNAGRFEEAVSAFKKALQIAPDNILGHILLTATYSIMGREKEARAEATEVLRINPKFSLDYFAKRLTYKDQSEADKVVNALRKAGLK
ncbi:MAG: tetratricopeptide repeat protein [Thermodesulfobacteriota bacterium]|jgi:adenylate cyclase